MRIRQLPHLKLLPAAHEEEPPELAVQQALAAVAAPRVRPAALIANRLYQ